MFHWSSFFSCFRRLWKKTESDTTSKINNRVLCSKGEDISNHESRDPHQSGCSQQAGRQLPRSTSKYRGTPEGDMQRERWVRGVNEGRWRYKKANVAIKFHGSCVGLLFKCLHGIKYLGEYQDLLVFNAKWKENSLFCWSDKINTDKYVNVLCVMTWAITSVCARLCCEWAITCCSNQLRSFGTEPLPCSLLSQVGWAPSSFLPPQLCLFLTLITRLSLPHFLLQRNGWRL